MTGRRGEADAVVVGAGPAGAVFARELARRGHHVVVLDRAAFPRPKPCGECVNPGAVGLLEQLDLLPDIRAAAPARLSGWELRSPGSPPVRGTFHHHVALGIPRSEFDARLVRAARAAGVEVHERTNVTTITRTRTGWAVGTRPDDGTDAVIWDAPLLVGADGLRSRVARGLGAIAHPPRLRKASMTFHLAGTGPDRARGLLAVGNGITLGLAPVHANEPRWNATVVVPAGRPARSLANDPAHALRSALAALGPAWEHPPEIVGGPWSSGPFDWPTRRIAWDDAVLIGDAAGYFDPFTGQGIYRALRSATMAAARVHEAFSGDRTLPDALRAYGTEYRRAVAAPRRLQRVIDRTLAHRAGRRLALHVLAAAPGAMNRIIHVTGDVAPVASLWRHSASPSPFPP